MTAKVTFIYKHLHLHGIASPGQMVQNETIYYIYIYINFFISITFLLFLLLYNITADYFHYELTSYIVIVSGRTFPYRAILCIYIVYRAYK